MKTSFWRRWWHSIGPRKTAHPISRACTRRTVLRLEALEDRTLLSAAPNMLADVNPATLPSYPSDIRAIGSTVYFAANDGVHNSELWKSDGTAAGTTLLQTFTPSGSSVPNPGNLTDVNGTLFFTSDTELWKSDGTTAGTTLVMDIYHQGTGPANPTSLTNVNGTLYFAGNDGSHGQELWKSDGTAAGTVMVKDIYPGSGGSYPFDLTNVNGTLFFVADDGTDGYQLWKSDGTDAGTTLVKNINPGSTFLHSDVGHLADVKLTGGNDTLFFEANDGTHGFELWKSDGTAAGTVMVKDINPGSYGSYPRGLTDVNGTLYFVATGSAGDDELWKSDGTAAGTTVVKAVSINPYSLTDVNGTLFFAGNGSGETYQLWKSDGTAAGTTMVTDTYYAFGPRYLTDVNGTLFFRGVTGTDNSELWKSDGTAAGTALVKDINPGNSGSSLTYLVDANGTLFFAADDGIHGSELWKSDGTTAGTSMVKDINTTSTSGPGHASDFTSAGGTTFFVADDGIGNGLWKTDGTTDGTTLVREFDSPGSGTYPSSLTDINGTLFFADQGALWKSDGTAAGTTVVTYTSSTPYDLTNVNGTLFFEAAGSLYRSDGTAAGTTAIKQVAGYNLTDANGTLLFAGDDGVNGTELWKSDGTTAGTTLIKDIFPGTSIQYYYGYYGGRYSVTVPNSSNPHNLTTVGGTTFFVAYDGVGNGLWKTDGTAAGTTLVKEPGSDTYPSYLTDFNGTLYFAEGGQLWESDGTATGTTAVADVAVSSPLIDVNGTLFFAGNDGVHGRELWKSDGTAAGTVMVKDINSGSAGSNPTDLTNVNGTLYCAADDGTSGVELWQSDGTAAGTALVMDINPGSSSSNPANLTNVNGTLFFRADDGVHGPQPWVLPPTINAVPAASLTVSGFPATTTAGTACTFTVTARNADGTTDTGYTGTVHFTSSDPNAVLPADTTLSNGTGQFTATLDTVGDQSLTATDTSNASLTATQAGIQVVPLATISGPSAGAIGQALTYALGAAGALPANDSFTFTVRWGDGSTTQTTSTTASHSYTAAGSYAVSVTAADRNGFTSPAAALAVNVLPVSVTIEADPANTSKQLLVVTGTAGSDSIVLGSGAGSGVTLTFDGTALGTIVPSNGSPFALVEVFGEGGNDTLDARGLSVSSVLVGGSGNDTLYGGSARNLLIGGTGADTLYAGSAGDILIGGYTAYDSNVAALASIMAEWDSTDSYTTRVNKLTNGGGLNGSYVLNSTTVHDDNTTDVLYGGSGLDWFFAHIAKKNGDQVKNRTSGEVLTGI